MKLLILLGWLLVSCVVWNQNNPLPYVKNGAWSLVDTNGRLLKKTDYSYIHHFDEEGYTFFCKNGGYGIMNRFGEVVLEPVYADVQQKGYGHYQLHDGNGWIPFARNGFQLVGNDTIQSFETLSVTWALTGMNDKWYIEHLRTGNRWQLKDSTVSYHLLHDHLWLVDNDTTQLLINGNGELVVSGKLDFRSQNQLYDVSYGKNHYVFDAHGPWQMAEIENVIYEESAVFVKTKKEGIYCGYDQSVLLRGNYEEITDFDAQYFMVRRNGLVSLVDRGTNKQAIPFLYENIYPRLDSGYNVDLQNNTGWLDKNFKTVIPCKYERFNVEGNLARVYELSYAGLFSMKTKKEILPPVYNSITQSGNRYKAIRNDLITIIELSDQHKVVKTAKIDNVIVVQSLKPGGSVRPKFIDPRLFALGWFLDSSYITPPNASPFYAVKWGLKDVKDSIIIPSSLSELRYVPLAPYTMLSAGSIDFPYGKFPYRRIQNTYPVYLPTGKIMSNLAIIGYDSTDFRKRAFMRASTVKGLGILLADGTYKPYSFIEKGTNRHLLICEAKSVEITEAETEEKTEVTFLNYTGAAIAHPSYALNFLKEKTIKGFTYPEGKWNYLQPDGTPLFDKPFSYAQPFLGNQALVKVGKKWGVVNPDTLIIPAVYSGIERKIVERDTFFIAQQTQAGTRLLDSASRTLNDYTVFGSRGNVLILEIGGQKQLYSADLKPLSEAYSSMKFLKNGFILAKTKKEYALLDPEGTVFYLGADPPVNVLCSAFLLFDDDSFTLRDRSDNVIVEGCTSIEAQGNYIVYKKNGTTSVMDLRGNLIVDETTGSVIIDTLGNYLAALKKGKTTIYEGPTRIRQIKHFTPTHFIGGKLLVNTKDSCVVYSISGKPEQVFDPVESLKILENGSIFLKTTGKTNLLFDREWKPVLPEEPKFRQLVNLGPAIYAYATAEGKTVLYNEETGEADSSFRIGFGGFESDRLLVKKGGRFSYVDTHFKAVTTRTFSQAIPFAGNHAAVADQRGWTLIDHQCNPLTYPNYGEIKALNAQLFKTQKLPLYGLYNAQGKLLIPVEYEQIRFLPNGIVLCVKEGAFYYFRKNGNPLPML